MNVQQLISRARNFGGKRFTSTVPLFSDPFSMKNMYKIRETTEKFSRPYFLSFDGFGTLYTPKVDVAKQYYEVARSCGIDTTLQDITLKFPLVFKELLHQFPNYGKHSEMITTSDDWWREVIVRVLGIDHYSDSAQSAKVCDELLTHFTGDAYTVYPDVISTLTQLKEAGIKLVVSSNSDPRVTTILDNLGLSQYFDAVYTSYEIGYSKPHKAFFDNVLSSMNCKPDPFLLQNIWHIGDSHSEDFLGPIKAGWNGILIDRSKQVGDVRSPENDACFHQNGSEPSEIVKIANNRVIITSLSQISSLFSLS